MLTDDEKRIVGDLSYGDIYRKMVAGMMTLRERGLAIYDLGDIFANEKGTIYADHIHYLARRQGREPRQPHDGRPHRGSARRDVGAAEEAVSCRQALSRRSAALERRCGITIAEAKALPVLIALGSAILFGLSTPVAKLLLGEADPWMLVVPPRTGAPGIAVDRLSFRPTE